MQAPMHLLRWLAAPTSALAPQQASWESAALRSTAYCAQHSTAQHSPLTCGSADTSPTRALALVSCSHVPPSCAPSGPAPSPACRPCSCCTTRHCDAAICMGLLYSCRSPALLPARAVCVGGGGGWGGEDQSVWSVLAGRCEVDGSGISTHCVLGP